MTRQEKRERPPPELGPNGTAETSLRGMDCPPEWCPLNRFSEHTGRHIQVSGTGPVVTKLSRNRIGITVANNARCQKSRVRG
jgi:hypothetical protein